MIAIIKRYFNKHFLLILGIILFFFLLGFYLLKEQYYYEVVDRFYNYPLEFVRDYYQDDISKLIMGKYFMVYKAPYLIDIFSSIYLYFITFSTIAFKILLFLLPVFIFFLVHRIFGCDFYDQFYQAAIYRIGRVKYMIGHFLGAGLLGGLLCILPKMIYYFVLRYFFVGGYSLQFYIDKSNWIPEPYLFSAFEMSPDAMLFIDLGISFLYGVVLAFLSIAIILIVRGKYVSYIAYILVVLVECVFTSVFYGYNQILIHSYSYLDFVAYQPQSGSVLLPMLSFSVALAFLFAVGASIRKLWYQL